MERNVLHWRWGGVVGYAIRDLGDWCEYRLLHLRL